MPLPSVTESSELPAASFGAVDGKLRAGSLVSWVLQGLGLLVRPSLVAAASIPVLVLAILFAQHAGPLVEWMRGGPEPEQIAGFKVERFDVQAH